MPDTNVVFDNATAYERFMGAWSRAIGEKFLTWLAAPSGKTWLDVGCGTGAFSELILARCAPAAVTGVDPAPAQVEHAKKQIPKASFRVGDALSLPFGDGEFDIVSSALVLHFLPDRAKAFSEMRRVAKAGGIVTGYTWNRTAAETFAPYAPMARGLKGIGVEPTLSPLVPEAAPEGLKSTLTGAGFRDIDITAIEATRDYADFDEFWQIQTMTFHPVGKSVAALTDEQRRTLRDKMKSTMAPGADGRVSFSSRAVAFKATK